MSSVPSWVPPNQTQRSVPSGSLRRFDAWHWTVEAGMSSTRVSAGLLVCVSDDVTAMVVVDMACVFADESGGSAQSDRQAAGGLREG